MNNPAPVQQSSGPSKNAIFGTLFQDSADPNRFLRIKEEKTDTVICRVFFGPNKNNLCFSGLVELPKKLFFFDGGSRIGFNPAKDPPAKVTKLPMRRREDED